MALLQNIPHRVCYAADLFVIALKRQPQNDLFDDADCLVLRPLFESVTAYRNGSPKNDHTASI